MSEEMNPSEIPELADDLECFWCGGQHSEGEVCEYAPYYISDQPNTDEDENCIDIGDGSAKL